jgi:type IV pilus assembly protein PilO
MNFDAIKAILSRVPFSLLLVLYLGYLGYSYHSFMTDADSPLILKQAEVAKSNQENVGLQAKLKAAQDFYRSLDAKRSEIRKLAKSLDELKGTVSAEVDVPAFTKMVHTEARKVGLEVVKMSPLTVASKEYYEEHPFELTFHGVYVQLLVFLDRLSKVQNIVRVDDFDIKPLGASTTQFVTLNGVVKIKTFKYLGTKADEVASASNAPAAPTDPTQAKPKQGGG